MQSGLEDAIAYAGIWNLNVFGRWIDMEDESMDMHLHSWVKIFNFSSKTNQNKQQNIYKN